MQKSLDLYFLSLCLVFGFHDSREKGKENGIRSMSSHVLFSLIP